jgi:ribosomal protein S17E
LASLLTNAYAEKFHYGYRTNKKVINDLKVKLPVKENQEPD